MAKGLPNYLEIAYQQIDEIVHLRSKGVAGVEVAGRLNLAPWQVYALTRFIKVLLTTDEKAAIEEQAQAHGFATAGEYIMDVFHNYEKAYDRKQKREAK